MDFLFCDNVDESNLPVYFFKNYNKIFAEYDKSIFKYLVISKNNKKIILPLLLHKTNDIYEGYSSYGYGGFFGEKTLFNESEVTELKNFCKSKNIIDLFFRSSPFLENEKFLPKNYNIFNRTTYIKKIKKYDSFDEYKKSINQKIRWSVNYAQRHSVSLVKKEFNQINSDDINKFYSIYKKTMDFRKTTDYYYFSKDFFKNTVNLLENNCDIYFAYFENNIIATSMFIKDKNYVHYHFSALDRNYYKYQPMEYLLSVAMFDYGNLDYKFMHLGGGLSINSTDGLSKFKKKLSDIEKSFYITKIICDNKKYSELRKKLSLENNNLFLIKDALL